MKIKICGITNSEDAQLCVKYGVDALGFVFYPKSKRYITTAEAKKIIEGLPVFVHKVGVFVDEKIEKVNQVAKETGLTVVQLHGNETPEYVSKINYSVIKSFGVDENFNFSIIEKYPNCGILLDVKDFKNYGGTGKTFDWSLIPDRFKKKVIIAGGVSINNIEQIRNSLNPYGIDLSSSVEKTPGIKDKEKVKELLGMVNKINRDNKNG